MVYELQEEITEKDLQFKAYKSQRDSEFNFLISFSDQLDLRMCEIQATTNSSAVTEQAATDHDVDVLRNRIADVSLSFFIFSFVKRTSSQFLFIFCFSWRERISALRKSFPY